MVGEVLLVIHDVGHELSVALVEDGVHLFDSSELVLELPDLVGGLVDWASGGVLWGVSSVHVGLEWHFWPPLVVLFSSWYQIWLRLGYSWLLVIG